jgi:hypothetical protein
MQDMEWKGNPLNVNEGHVMEWNGKERHAMTWNAKAYNGM